jgi:uncharacterized membrane protein
MASLAVWQFDAAGAAARSAALLERWGRDDVLVIHGAAVVTWEVDDGRPRTSRLSGALGTGFWGLLFGLIFFVPLLGAAIGATTGALAGALADVGIDDHFINRVRDQVTPGTSALFLVTTEAVVTRVHEALAELHPTLITADLDDDQEAALRAVFGD